MIFLEVINRGGFGRVDKVKLPDGRIVARKVFDPLPDIVSGADIEKLKKRFKREVRVQKSLSGTFSIPVLEHDLDCENPWFTMPFCEKNYGDQVLEDKRNGIVSKEALADILNALEELHKLGYVHRDLKPQNILFHDGRWKLTDFGLVLPSSSETTKLTSADSAWGTQMYCAPEQAQNFKSATPKVDIYAFGCILHDIYSDSVRLPFNKHTCNGQVGTIIEKCTEINPQRRFKNIASLRSAFFSLVDEKINTSYSDEAQEWVEQLNVIDQWDSTRLQNLVRFILNHEGSSDDMWAIFYHLDEDRFVAIYAIDKEYAETVTISYCDWIKRTSFDFSFCDVLASRLESLYTIGSIESKAMTILALAQLGWSHNRYHVMNVLLRICSNNLDDALAERVAIEIQVEEMHNQFKECARIINEPVDIYHSSILKTLS